MNLHALTEALYLAAAILATFGLAVRKPRLSRAAVGALAAGAVVHAAAFLQIHQFKVPPKLTGLPGAVSLAAWLGTLFFLALVRRPRFDALVVIVAPAAFLMGMALARARGARLLLGDRTDRVFRGAALFALAAFLLYRATDLVAVSLAGVLLVGAGVGLMYPSSLARAMARKSSTVSCSPRMVGAMPARSRVSVAAADDP